VRVCVGVRVSVDERDLCVVNMEVMIYVMLSSDSTKGCGVQALCV